MQLTTYITKKYAGPSKDVEYGDDFTLYGIKFKSCKGKRLSSSKFVEKIFLMQLNKFNGEVLPSCPSVIIMGIIPPLIEKNLAKANDCQLFLCNLQYVLSDKER